MNYQAGHVSAEEAAADLLTRLAFDPSANDAISPGFDGQLHPASSDCPTGKGMSLAVGSLVGLVHPSGMGRSDVAALARSCPAASGYPHSRGTGAFLPGPLDALALATPFSTRPVCSFFLRTGTCAYGDRCKFVHPPDRPTPVLNSRGYPVREDEADCAHYLKKGWCAFNLTCKFNHPELPLPILPGYSFAGGGGQPYDGMASCYPGIGALYSAPPTLPLMYYSPAGASALGANSYMPVSFPGDAAMQAAYAPGLAAGPAAYWQAPLHKIGAAGQQQGSLYLQQDRGAVQGARRNGSPAPRRARTDQLTSAMHKLQLNIEPPRQPPQPQPQQLVQASAPPPPQQQQEKEEEETQLTPQAVQTPQPPQQQQQ